ncbi:Wzz/FepE/Etk N-terminal domain-containing protein [Acidobacterium sp. S8]|uniref:GumC family protein n=1 Tax=Acidobacterium sp. S8 TaxID=1641854 RepID=UPI00131C7877|nr:Wzz/FepE/Etk N-terminal domain-containing protein [Acidobacterium sp. S8]
MSISNGLNHPNAVVLYRIKKHRKLFFVAFTITFVLIAAVVMLLPPKYESEMKLLVNTGRQDLIISPSEDKNGTQYQELAEIRINSEIELLKSRDVLQQVVLRSGLLKTSGKSAGQNQELDVDRAVHGLAHRLDIEAVKKSEIISVSYRAKSPAQANTILKNLAEVYLGEHLKAHATPGSLKFFDEQANVYANRLAQSEEQLRIFRQNHSALADPDEKDPLAQRTIEAQASLDDTEAQESEYKKRVQAAESVLTGMNQRVTSEIRTSPQSGLIAQLSAMLAELENRRTEMITKFRPDDRFVVELDKEIADTKNTLNSVTEHSSIEQVSDLNQIHEDAEKNLVVSKVTLAGLEARRSQMMTFVQGYKDQMSKLAASATENEQLVRTVKEDEDNYLLYSKRREEARIAESLDQKRITDVSLIETPTFQLEPVSPVVPLDLTIGLLFSLMVAYLCVRVREHLNSPRPVDHNVNSTSAMAA